MTRFPIAMRIMHWGVAVLVLGLLVLGIYMADLPLEAPDKFDLYPIHRAVGIFVFILVFVRLVIRLRSSVPEMPATIPEPARIAAKSAQVFFYVALMVIRFSATLRRRPFPNFQTCRH